jgi:hypothetical protein
MVQVLDTIHASNPLRVPLHDFKDAAYFLPCGRAIDDINRFQTLPTQFRKNVTKALLVVADI